MLKSATGASPPHLCNTFYCVTSVEDQLGVVLGEGLEKDDTLEAARAAGLFVRNREIFLDLSHHNLYFDHM